MNNMKKLLAFVATLIRTATKAAATWRNSDSGSGVGPVAAKLMRLAQVVIAGSLMAPLVAGAAVTATTTTVVALRGSVPVGDAATFQATVTGAAPTGFVTFKDGTAIIGTRALAKSGNSMIAKISTSSLKAGSRRITAEYAGNANNGPSVSPAITQEVTTFAAMAGQQTYPTTTDITSAVNPSAEGQSVTFHIIINGWGVECPAGTVTIRDAGVAIGTATVNACGIDFETSDAYYTTSSLSAGSHNITASYPQNSTNRASTSAVLVQVVNATPLTNTSTSLTSSVNPSAFLAGTTFTASVTGAAPTGTVNFMEGATILGAASLSGSGNTRTATFTTASFASAGPGTHSITAVYAGDSGNNSSTSSALIQTVNPQVTSISIASSANPSLSGSSVSFTATVTGYLPGGTVTFKDGATTLGTASLTGSTNSNTATFSTSSLAAGLHSSITATYGGDAYNAASPQSSPIAQNVQTTTTTSVAASSNPSGLGASVTFTATVTGVAPTGTVTFKDGAATLGTASLVGSGNSRTATFATSSLAVGSHSITAVYGGDSTNVASTSSALNQTVSQAASTTSLTSNSNPSVLNASVSFTATVTGSSPTGTVTFKDGGTTLGSPVALSGGTASISTSALSQGAHSITATYSGDGNNAASISSTLTQTVQGLPATTTSVTSNSNPSVVSSSVSFTATVAGTNPTGTVTFMDGGVPLGGAVALSGGAASFSNSGLSQGTHSITASYSGDSNNAASSGGLTQTVQGASSTSVGSSANPSVQGGSVTFTATVTGLVPTGSVTFKNGGSDLGTVGLTGSGNSKTATFSSSALPVGGNSITAVYLGDGLNLSSTSSPVAQTVKAASNSSVASSLNPSTAGSSVTFTATVTGSSPTGNVSFIDGSTTLGTTALTGAGNSRTATYTTSSLSQGPHSITVSYAGDANNVSSSSGGLTQTVLATTSTSLTSSVNPSLVGANVTFTATVIGNAPTGTVTFMDGATTLGTGTLAGSGNTKTATFSTSSLAQAAHSITAVYGGNGSNAGSTSSAVAQQVNAPLPATTTTVSSSLNPSINGANVTFTAMVTGSALPTGTVVFTDGGVQKAMVNLTPGGTASYTTNGLTVGSHTIAASYSGDANNAASASGNLIQTVSSTGAATLQSYGIGKPCGSSCGAIGAYIHAVALDVSVGGVPVVLTYNNLLNGIATVAGFSPLTFGQNLAVGPFWSSNFHKNLRIDNAGAAVQVFQGDTFVISYIRNAAGTYVADADISSSLVAITGGYRYTTSSSIETYDSTGALTTIEHINGTKLTFAYSAGLLNTVTDNFGKSISFAYSSGRVSSVVAQDLKATQLGYGPSGYLNQITWPDNSIRKFLYEDASHPWALTGVTGEDNLRKQTISYDDSGALAYTELGEAWVGRKYYYTKYGVDIAANPVVDAGTGFTTSYFFASNPGSMTVLAAGGAMVDATSSSVIQGLPIGTTITGSPGSGSAQTVVTKTPDSAGNITSSTHSDGYKSCSTFDSLNRVTASIVGLPAATSCATVTPPGSTLPADSQATYLSWHPTWELPTQVLSNQGQVTLVYNGASDPISSGTASCAPGLPNLSNGLPTPVLCKRYTRAVTASLVVDATVPMLTESFSYDANGRVLSSTDITGAVTSYLYGAYGRLQRITDPLLNLTAIDSYDDAGRVLQTTDQNGIVTVNTYHDRGWLQTRTVTPPGKPAQTTSISRYLTGSVHTVLAPNGILTTYTYDNSDRLKKVQAANGIVEYGLDNDGNVLTETYKDLSNNVLRTVTRVPDQLGRPARITGSAN